jgi:hypothetical protein
MTTLITVDSYGKYMADLFDAYIDSVRTKISADLLPLLVNIKSEYDYIIPDISDIAEDDYADDFSITRYFKLIDNNVTICSKYDDWDTYIEYGSDMIDIDDLVDSIASDIDSAIQINPAYLHFAEYLAKNYYWNISGETIRAYYLRQTDILDRYHLTLHS